MALEPLILESIFLHGITGSLLVCNDFLQLFVFLDLFGLKIIAYNGVVRFHDFDACLWLFDILLALRVIVLVIILLNFVALEYFLLEG